MHITTKIIGRITVNKKHALLKGRYTPNGLKKNYIFYMQFKMLSNSQRFIDSVRQRYISVAVLQEHFCLVPEIQKKRSSLSHK